MKRNTLQKEIILQTIKSRTNIKKETLIETVCANYPSISPSTVYRNIASLIEDGVIRECAISGVGIYYEMVSNAHDHFICTQCGKIIDIPKIAGVELKKIAHKELGDVDIEHVQIDFFGVCADCKNIK